jgi:hypothetical protein
MNGEPTVRRGQLRGYVFEVVIRHLLALNDFYQIKVAIPNKVNVTSYNKIEIKGRGTWHQIDSPCLYKKTIPFIYDIRLLAEVKFYSNEIQKNKVREYVGTIKDISENYFIDNLNTIENQSRYTDIGVFFAANGFQVEAERLAFVHGIKTISYNNNAIMNDIKPTIERLEANCLRANVCISDGNQSDFMDQLAELLKDPENPQLLILFENRFKPENNFIHHLNDLSWKLLGIRSSFFGVTGTNFFIHFLSHSDFPGHLFQNTDERECRVYYEEQEALFYLQILDDYGPHESRFQFSAPRSMLDEVFHGGSSILNEKGRHFSQIKISTTINNINRNLTLKLDNTWIEGLKLRRRVNGQEPFRI